MNTTSPSKNLPAAARVQISDYMLVVDADESGVPSRHNGVSSM
jgi:hypothetical protein